jgi:hypothetical protein
VTICINFYAGAPYNVNALVLRKKAQLLFESVRECNVVRIHARVKPVPNWDSDIDELIQGPRQAAVLGAVDDTYTAILDVSQALYYTRILWPVEHQV